MRHHHHQPVLCDLLEQVHDLQAGVAVERAGGLVRQQDLRVVDKRPCDRHALHLSARELRRLFVDMLAQADLFERFLGTCGAVACADAADGQRQLHVFENGLVRDQVVALEHKADRMVAVAVPVAVAVFFGRDAVDDQIACVVAVESADDIQQRGLAGAALPQDGDKFVVAQAERNALERLLHQRAGFVYLFYTFDLQHIFSLKKHRMSMIRYAIILP